MENNRADANPKPFFGPRTLADLNQMDRWVLLGRTDEQIFNRMNSPGWRSEVIELPLGGYMCSLCRQQITIQTCIECHQTLRNEKAIFLADAYNIALFLLTRTYFAFESVPGFLKALSESRGQVVQNEELCRVADEASKEVLNRKVKVRHGN